MTFEVQEVSSQDGAPVGLYEIVWGGTVWRYTSADQDVEATVDGAVVTYTAVAISDSGMVQGGSSANDLTISAPSDIPLADLFRSTPPSDEIKLTVRRKHYGDPNVFIYWKGFITNVKSLEGNAAIQIIGGSILSLFQSQGLRLGWTRGCPHVVYDGECRLNPDDYAVAAGITALTGNAITVDAAGGNAAGYFTGGYIEWEANDDGTLDRRGIMASTGDLDFVLLGSTYRLEVGMAITLIPGCDLTTTTCKDKFDNLANYGGCAQMTGKNPFDGTAIL